MFVSHSKNEKHQWTQITHNDDKIIVFPEYIHMRDSISIV